MLTRHPKSYMCTYHLTTHHSPLTHSTYKLRYMNSSEDDYDHELIIQIPQERVLKSYNHNHNKSIGFALIVIGVSIIVLPVLSFVVLEFIGSSSSSCKNNENENEELCECSWFIVCNLSRFILDWWPRLAASGTMAWLGLACAYVALICFGVIVDCWLLNRVKVRDLIYWYVRTCIMKVYRCIIYVVITMSFEIEMLYTVFHIMIMMYACIYAQWR